MGRTSFAVARPSVTPGGIAPPIDRAVTATLLAAELAGAHDAEQAIAIALRLCGRRFPVRAAVFLEDRDRRTMRLCRVQGLPRTSRADLGAQLGTLPVDPSANRLRFAARAFERVSGSASVSVIHAGPAIVLAGDVPTADQGLLEDVGALLATTLDRLGREERREYELDLGLAMTAHELRGPLLGARVALHLAARSGGSERRTLLLQTERELAELSAKVDALLRWSVGAASLRLARVDLVRLVREAVRACMVEDGHLRVDLIHPTRLTVVADPVHLRSAIENVVRNALAYSPSGSTVDVRAYLTKAGRATVAIRDRGPGIPAEERDLVFDPLTRGLSSGARAGNGLGLFVAKRVMDAHGGDLSFRPAADGIGTVFRLRLPERRG